MIPMSIRNCFIVILSFFLFHESYAQTGTVLRASVDKNRILIGEPILLTITADIPENEVIRFPVIDGLPHFEIQDNPTTDTTNTSYGTSLKQVIRITSFDSGHWVIPSFVLTDKLITDTIPIDVVFSVFDPNLDYHDIKDIIEIKPEEKKTPWWYYALGGAGVIIIGLIIYLLVKKKKPIAVKREIVIDPYTEAINELDQLQQKKITSKEYYTVLTDIFRLYIFKRKGIHSLQETINDLVVQLRSLGLPEGQYKQLTQALQMGDFVKFAKYEPSSEEKTGSLDTIKTVITMIEKSIIPTNEKNIV